MEIVVTSYEVLVSQPRPRLVELIGQGSLRAFLAEASTEFNESSRRLESSLLISVMYRGPRHCVELEAWETCTRGAARDRDLSRFVVKDDMPDLVMAPQYDYYASRVVRDVGDERKRLSENMKLFYGADHLLRALIDPKATHTLAFACSPVHVLPVF